MKKDSFRVKGQGNRYVTVGRHAKGWRFGYWDNGEWRYVTRKKKRIIDETGDPDLLRRMPVPVACFLSGCSQKQLAQRCRIIRDNRRNHYVTLIDYKAAFLPPEDTPPDSHRAAGPERS